MDYEFTFVKGRENTEVFRIPVHDPADVVGHILNENSNITPDSLSKIELIIGTVVVSTSTNEITWQDDIIQIKPSVENLSLIPKRAHSKLVVYDNDEGTKIAQGIVVVDNDG